MSSITARPAFLSITFIVLPLLTVAVAACGSDSQSSAEESARLRSEAEALLRVDGCPDVSFCDVKAMGRQSCGDPVNFVVVCTKTTNIPALDAKLVELIESDQQHTRDLADEGVAASTCERTQRPEVAMVDGLCRPK